MDFNYPQNVVELEIIQTGLSENDRIEEIGKSVGILVSVSNLLKI